MRSLVLCKWWAYTSVWMGRYKLYSALVLLNGGAILLCGWVVINCRYQEIANM